MNKKTLVLIVLVLLYVVSTIVLVLSIHKYLKKPSGLPIAVDTVYVNKPYTQIPQYKIINVPYLVTFWTNQEVKIDTVYVDSTKVHYSIPSGYIEFNHQFLLQYSESSKLVQMVTSRNHLDLTFIKPDGLIRTENYTFYPDINYYNYQNNELTYKRKPFIERFEVSPELMVRPLVNMYDVNLGLKYKTRKIYYEVGLNSYYYPVFENKFLGITPYLRLTVTL